MTGTEASISYFAFSGSVQAPLCGQGAPALLLELPNEPLRLPSLVRPSEIRIQLTSGPGFAAVRAGAAVTPTSRVLRSLLCLVMH